MNDESLNLETKTDHLKKLLQKLKDNCIRWEIHLNDFHSELVIVSLTQSLKSILSFFEDHNLNLVTAAKRTKGLPFLLTELRRSPELRGDKSFVLTYANLLNWFIKKSDLSICHDEDSAVVERGRNWALSELGILLGRKDAEQFIPHAKLFGFQVDDPLKFFEQQQQERLQQQQQQQNEPLDHDIVVDSLENFLLEALQVFSDAQESEEEDESKALEYWLIKTTQREPSDYLDADITTNYLFRPIVFNHPFVAHSLVALLNDLTPRFAETRLKILTFKQILLECYKQSLKNHHGTLSSNEMDYFPDFCYPKEIL